MNVQTQLSERAQINKELLALSEAAKVSEVLNAEFWSAVGRINNNAPVSKAKKSKVEARLRRLDKKGLTESAFSASARCIYRNIEGVIYGNEKMTEHLQQVMVQNIRWLAEGAQP